MDVCLVCEGDAESHSVIRATVSLPLAVRLAEDLVTQRWDDEARRYYRHDCGCNPRELTLWEVDTGRHRGRIFGYICVESHTLEWELGYERSNW